jgi:hypothetical protein
MSVFNPYRVNKVRDFHAEPISLETNSLPWALQLILQNSDLMISMD